MKIQGIYKIINCINGKIYIGQSTDIKTRFSCHKHNALVKKINRPLYTSIRKYGIENFEFIILEKVDNILLLDQIEQYWMDFYKSYDKKCGYNLSTNTSVNRGYKLSEETRLKFSERQKRLCQNPDYIENLSNKSKELWENPEFRKNYSEKIKIKNQDPKRKEQLSKQSKELWQDENYRKNMSEARKNSEEKRIATINNKKESDPNYQNNILEKRKETGIKNGTTKIYSIDKDKVKRLYIDENYELKDVARIMNLSFGLLAKFVRLNNIKKRKGKSNKVKPIISDAQLHELCNSVNMVV